MPINLLLLDRNAEQPAHGAPGGAGGELADDSPAKDFVVTRFVRADPPTVAELPRKARYQLALELVDVLLAVLAPLLRAFRIVYQLSVPSTGFV